jgi:predicted ferric reductase
MVGSMGVKSEAVLRSIAQHLDQRNFHRLAKVVVLVLGAWFGGLMAQRTWSDPSLLNISAVGILALLTLWYFLMVSAMVLQPLIKKINGRNP